MKIDKIDLIHYNRIKEIYEMFVRKEYITRLDWVYYYKSKRALVLKQLESAKDFRVCKRLLRKADAAFKEYVSFATPIGAVCLEEVAAE